VRCAGAAACHPVSVLRASTALLVALAPRVAYTTATFPFCLFRAAQHRRHGHGTAPFPSLPACVLRATTPPSVGGAAEDDGETVSPVPLRLLTPATVVTSRSCRSPCMPDKCSPRAVLLRSTPTHSLHPHARVASWLQFAWNSSSSPSRRVCVTMDPFHPRRQHGRYVRYRNCCYGLTGYCHNFYYSSRHGFFFTLCLLNMRRVPNLGHQPICLEISEILTSKTRG